MLDLLAALEVKATFFVVVERAEKEPGILAETLAAGHAVGNHSLDHTWGRYFRHRFAMRSWIAESETRLEALTGSASVGFRSPAGVRTPNLHWALEDLGVPLVHWSLRFFDSVRPWEEGAALRSLGRARPGSIVLLHDTHRSSAGSAFRSTLRRFVEAARASGFGFERLERELVERAGSTRRS